MPQRLFYNLFATDGFINLPTDPSGTLPRRRTYVFGFVGGLFKTQPIDSNGVPVGPPVVVNPQYDTSVPSNLGALRGTAVIPSPRVDMDLGDELYITLVNLGMYLTDPPILDVRSIHIHGGHLATHLDGVPETSFGVPVTPPDAPLVVKVTYFFKPDKPGTYFYHCHQDAPESVQMGMYGALVVYPSMASLAAVGITKDARTGRWYYKWVPQPQIPAWSTNRNFGYNDISSFFISDWVLLLSDIDTRWHQAVLTQGQFNPVDYKPHFWLVNGRAFPDTLLPTSLPQSLVPDYGYSIPDGYSTYVRVLTSGPLLTAPTSAGGSGTGGMAGATSVVPKTKPADRFLFRLANLGYQPVPWHVHGWQGTIVGRDSSLALPGEPSSTTLVGSGETYDVLFVAEDKRNAYADYVFCGKAGFPPLKDQVATATAHSIVLGTFRPPFPGAADLWDNIPLETSLGQGAFTPPYNWVPWNYGTNVSNNYLFPQFYVALNHDFYKVTNDGVYPGGQLIFIETDFPGSDYKLTPPAISEPIWVCKTAAGAGAEAAAAKKGW